MNRALCLTVLILFATWAQASPINQPPPIGAILDLNGLPIPGGGDGTTFQQYTVNFLADLASTAITFAFPGRSGFCFNRRRRGRRPDDREQQPSGKRGLLGKYVHQQRKRLNASRLGLRQPVRRFFRRRSNNGLWRPPATGHLLVGRRRAGI